MFSTKLRMALGSVISAAATVSKASAKMTATRSLLSRKGAANSMASKPGVGTMLRHALSLPLVIMIEYRKAKVAEELVAHLCRMSEEELTAYGLSRGEIPRYVRDRLFLNGERGRKRGPDLAFKSADQEPLASGQALSLPHHPNGFRCQFSSLNRPVRN